MVPELLIAMGIFCGLNLSESVLQQLFQCQTLVFFALTGDTQQFFHIFADTVIFQINCIAGLFT